jgi:hypothetical protein
VNETEAMTPAIPNTSGTSSRVRITLLTARNKLVAITEAITTLVSRSASANRRRSNVRWAENRGQRAVAC